MGYRVRNIVLRRLMSRAVKHDFSQYIQWYISQNNKFECGYRHSNRILRLLTVKIFVLSLECCKLRRATCDATKLDIINGIRPFSTENHRYAVTNFLRFSIIC